MLLLFFKDFTAKLPPLKKCILYSMFHMLYIHTPYMLFLNLQATTMFFFLSKCS